MSDGMYVDTDVLGAKLFADDVIGDIVNGHGSIGGNIDESAIQRRVDGKNRQAAEAKRAQQENKSVFSDNYDDDDYGDDDSDTDWSNLFNGEEDESDANSEIDDLIGKERPAPVDGDDDYIPSFTLDKAQDFFRELPDDVEIAPGFTKARVDTIIKNEDTVQKNAEFFQYARQKFDEGTQAINDHFGLGFVEAQKNIQAIIAKKNDPSTDAYTRGQLDIDLEKWKAKGDRMAATYNEIKRSREFQEQQNVNTAVHQANMIMQQRHKGRYNPNEVFTFAAQAGLTKKAISTAIQETPEFLEILMDAKAMREQRAKGGARLREAATGKPAQARSKAPHSTPSQAVRTDIKTEKELARRAFKRKAANGQYDSKEAFAFLID